MLSDSWPYRYHVDEGGLPGVLEPHQGQLHLLLPEQRLEPVEQLVDQRYHLSGCDAAAAAAARWLGGYASWLAG